MALKVDEKTRRALQACRSAAEWEILVKRHTAGLPPIDSEPFPAKGQRAQHEGGGLYFICGFGKMKDLETGDWFPSVNYVLVDDMDKTDDVYTRERTDFIRKFTHAPRGE